MANLQRLAIAPHQIEQQKVHLNPEQQHYLSRVLRLGEGDQLIVMDGKGNSWLAKLEAETSKKVQ
ncbi:RNA methyltransferase PUA domain-containing protein [Okeania sp. KiyG1]|uniref:RNA methyltransferase PUA domain-containing protein n=1 Tax=Okeania sp. KiyG1 TaxID=2720165 RepID=UPI0019939321|nr:RNA methyltransferase PUA domain-containing protein [Okeania sp. KiyG1]GGA19626.1 hypothetical protein CYANOKiyG1_34300 [Okeania sp. KiyG1]